MFGDGCNTLILLLHRLFILLPTIIHIYLIKIIYIQIVCPRYMGSI